MMALSTLTGPFGSHFAGQLPVLFATGDDVHVGTAVQCHLDHDVGTRTDSVDPQRSARRQLAALQRPETNNSGTQQERRRTVVEYIRQLVSKTFRDDGQFGETSVGMVIR